tara:strand:- start:42 stop:803 length:762 start_codon:yes stop_codon:yes gene_type:complete
MTDIKVIWITGASSGIGRALAIKFANEGWQVAASARRENLLDELNKINPNIHPFSLDVTDSEKCKSVFQKIINKFNKVDICVFSTGIHNPQAERQFNLEIIRKIMETNYFGTINSINSVIEYFKDKKAGQISIVSSVASYRGLPAAGAYCSSKSALSTFAESLYFDMKRFNVRVSIVSPGFIKTPMTDQNDFKMPMIQSAEFAADKIYNGLINSNSFEIHFPKTFSYMMKVLKILPNWMYLGLIEKANRFMKR